MFLRATRVQSPPEKVNDAIKNFETNILKNLRAAAGNQGAALLINRQTGEGIGVSYWESAKALQKRHPKTRFLFNHLYAGTVAGAVKDLQVVTV